MVDAIRQLCVVEEKPPETMKNIAWTPSLEDFRSELQRRPRGRFLETPLVDPFASVKDDLKALGMRDLLHVDQPLLAQAAAHLLEHDGGKKFRAAMVLLVARACNVTATPRQHSLAEITELIHTASLFHDDVIDRSSTRRGAPSVNAKYGDKVAILAGDFLLARACVALARLRDLDVVEILATVIEHLVRGEIVQMRPELSGGVSLEGYLLKNFYKTGSLMANSCRASAMLGGHDHATCDAAFAFGKHVGSAFQLADDVLDFCGTDASLGKPALADLKSGLATAPVLLAAEHDDSMVPLIQRSFQAPGDIDTALAILQHTDGINKARDLAFAQAELAADALEAHFPPSEARDALVALAAKVVTRQH